MRFYTLITILFAFLLIDLKFRDVQKQEYQFPQPDFCEVDTIDRVELNGYIGQDFTDTITRTIEVRFNSYNPQTSPRKRNWALKSKL